jgi:hypothetical protein
MKNTLLLPLLILTLLLAGCQQDAPPATTDSHDQAAAETSPASEPVDASTSTNAAWQQFVHDYIEASLAAHPAWAVYQGRHEFDGQMPDWSRSGIMAEIARLKQAHTAAREFSDGVLNEREQFQREYFIARIDHDLFWMEKANWPFRNPIHYLGWMSDSLDPSPYITLDYAPKAERMQAFISYLQTIPGIAAQIQDNLHMPMPVTWLQFGIDSFGGYADYFANDVPAVWAEVEDPGLHAAFKTANGEAVAAMRTLVTWLDSNRATATHDYALGADLYRQMLWDTERPGAGRPTAAGRTESIFARTGPGQHSRHRGSTGGRSTAVCALQLCLHQHSRPLGQGSAQRLQHRPAQSGEVSRGASRLHPRRS